MQKFDLIVTRHESLVELLIERGVVTREVPVIAHAKVEDVREKHVIGILPHHLAQHCDSVTEIPMSFTIEDRINAQKGDLPIERLREVAGTPKTYWVFGSQNEIDRFSDAPRERVRARAYQHLAQVSSGLVTTWGSEYEANDSRALRAVKAARAWIPYDLTGPGRIDGVTEQELHKGNPNMEVWGGGTMSALFDDIITNPIVTYTTSDMAIMAEAHRLGYVRFSTMCDSTDWIDVDSLEETRLWRLEGRILDGMRFHLAPNIEILQFESEDSAWDAAEILFGRDPLARSAYGVAALCGPIEV